MDSVSGCVLLKSDHVPFIPKHLISIINVVVKLVSSLYLINSTNLPFNISLGSRYLIIAGHIIKQAITFPFNISNIISCLSILLKQCAMFMYFLFYNNAQTEGVLVCLKTSFRFALTCCLDKILFGLYNLYKCVREFYQIYNGYVSFIENLKNFVSLKRILSLLIKLFAVVLYFYFILVANLRSSMFCAFLAVILEILMEWSDVIKLLQGSDTDSFFEDKRKKDSVHDFLYDMVAPYRYGHQEPLLGRDEELERLCMILSRKGKSNAVILGEAGVGKTSLVQRLAQLIATRKAPVELRTKRIFYLNMAALVGGTTYRGDFEKRVIKLIEFVQMCPGTILFIDELHTIVGAGSSEGGLDFVNIFKPLLTSGEIQCIGATTLDEYNKYVAKDPALQRRFQPVNLYPLSTEESKKMLDGLKVTYEQYHGCKYTEEAIMAAVDLSDRYVYGRHLPDKAVDAMDEAAVVAKNRIYKETGKVLKGFEVTASDVAKVISMQAKVPIISLTGNVATQISKIKEKLLSKVVGHKDAIEIICNTLKRSFSDIKDSVKPAASFLILGQHGTGKTLIAKELANSLVVESDHFICLDMNEFASEKSVSKIVGSAGKKNDGHLTEKVRRNPNSVILFDCIEKAHSNVLGVILNLLETGELSDSDGKKVNFSNSTIVITSSEASDNLNGLSGSKEDELEKAREKVLSSINRSLLNRIDNTIILNPLSKEDFEGIVEKELCKLVDRAEKKNIEITFEKSVVDFVVTKVCNFDLGARPVIRYIENHIENQVADAIIYCQTQRGRLCLQIAMNDSGDAVIVNEIDA